MDEIPQDRFRFFDAGDEPTIMLSPVEGYANVPLVSLEDAMEYVTEYKETLKKRLSDVRKSCPKHPADGLSIDDSAAIRLYTMEYKPKEASVYFILNSALRCERRNVLVPWFRYLKLLITALCKIRSKRLTVLRGVNRDVSTDHPIGARITWWGFSSCTTSVAVIEKGPFYKKTGEGTIFEIECHSGKDILQHSQYQGEQEVLLMAATQFEVISCDKRGDGQHIIHMREVESESRLIDLPPWPGDVHGGIERETSSAVDLSDIRINEQDMAIVGTEAIKKKSCTKLVLSNTACKSESISTLATYLGQSTTLKALDLSKNRLSNADLRSLTNELVTKRTHQERVPFLCFTKIKVSSISHPSHLFMIR